MAIAFQCIGCGKSLTAKDEHAGRRIKCGKCAAILTIPGGAKAVAVALAVPVAAVAAVEEAEEAPPQARAPHRRRHPWIDPMLDQVFTPWLPGDEGRFQRGIRPAREGMHPLATFLLILLVLGGLGGVGYYLYVHMFGH